MQRESVMLRKEIVGICIVLTIGAGRSGMAQPDREEVYGRRSRCSPWTQS